MNHQFQVLRLSVIMIAVYLHAIGKAAYQLCVVSMFLISSSSQIYCSSLMNIYTNTFIIWFIMVPLFLHYAM